MAIERTYYCEGPDCGGEGPAGGRSSVHCRTATPPPYLPSGFIEVRLHDNQGGELHHFCGWDCLMKYAASQPVPETIPWNEGGEDPV